MTTIHTHSRRVHWLLGMLLLASLCGAHTAQAQARFSYSADGAEVTDSKTGLIWRRCSAGQSWHPFTNACTGFAATYTHEAALAYAQAESATGWRLPNVKELSSITDKTRYDPAIDSTVFPAIPASWFWTSTPAAGNGAFPRAVNFINGAVNNSYPRSNAFRVRLVR